MPRNVAFFLRVFQKQTSTKADRPDIQLVSKYSEIFRVTKTFYELIDIHNGPHEMITAELYHS